MKLLNKFAEKHSLEVEHDQIHDQIQGSGGKIIGLSCACGGCLLLWCSSDVWRKYQSECKALVPFGGRSEDGFPQFSSGGRAFLFDPDDPGQVKLAFKLTEIASASSKDQGNDR
jgi:hypothetical protein